jgi:hypothetical protein
MLDKLNPGAGLCTKSLLTSTAPAAPPAPRALTLKISGQNASKARRTKAQRINLAKALHDGKVELAKPTWKQSAALARVSNRHQAHGLVPLR